MITKERKELKVPGQDFQLAMDSSVEACQRSRVRISLTMCTEKKDKDERKEWEKGQTNRCVAFQCGAIRDTEDEIFHFKKAVLFLAPFQASSPLFGAEAMSAIAAGVPTLVSKHSGLGSLLVEMDEKDSVVVETDPGTWAERIIQKLEDPDAAGSKAKKLRERILFDTKIAAAQMDFVKIIAGEYPYISNLNSVQVKVLD